jgi:predicted RNA-binding Zn-ribbon protein involved in translation (DUF1610 family)
MTETGAHFLPTREATEEQQQALFDLMMIADHTLYTCPYCGNENTFAEAFAEEPQAAALLNLSEWFDNGSVRWDQGQSGHPPDSPGLNPDYMIVAPSRAAEQDIQEAGRTLLNYVLSAERPCPGCGNAVRIQLGPNEDVQTINTVRRWLALTSTKPHLRLV